MDGRCGAWYWINLAKVRNVLVKKETLANVEYYVEKNESRFIRKTLFPHKSVYIMSKIILHN